MEKMEFHFSHCDFKKGLLHIIGEKEQERFCRDVCFSAHK